MAPKEARSELLEPVNVTLYGRRNFEGVIKSSSFRWALHVITSSYKRQAEDLTQEMFPWPTEWPRETDAGTQRPT